MTLPTAVALAAALAGVGRMLGWLTSDGMAAAAIIGAAVFAGADFAGAALLGLFFVSGSVLTAFNDQSRILPGDPSFNHTRTGRQVLANGLWPAAGAVAVGAGSDFGWPLFVGSLAAAQADTWATEIGLHAATPPRIITTGRSVAPGTSGGVTLLGTAAGTFGAAAIVVLASITGVDLDVCAIAFVGGVAGLISDSVLGATVQAVYYCTACHKETETRTHGCGQQARLGRGAAWINNDVVNLAGSGVGGLLATLLWTWL